MKYSEQTKDFFEQVYQIVRLIPKGRVTSYGSIAKALGTPKSSRIVGWAMNASHKHPDIPANRVLNRIGLLTGKMHFETETKMQELLEKEGVKVEKDQVVDFKNLFWDVQEELGKELFE